MSEGGIDMELKQAFMDLQEKAMDTSRKLRLADFQIDSLNKQKLMAMLADKEIETLDPSIQIYETVGRMFLLAPRDEVKTHLESRHKNAEKKIADINQKKEYLEKSLKEAENNLREMVTLRQKKM